MGASLYPYRVFISYSHLDRPKVEHLVNVLTEVGVAPMWDQNLTAGFEFSPEILKFITNAHVFLPFLTQGAMQRPWLNQEIGFAAALGKPILPVTLGDLPMGLSGAFKQSVFERILPTPPHKSALVTLRDW